MFQRILKQPSQLLPLCLQLLRQSWGQHQDSCLGNRSLDQLLDMFPSEAQSLQTSGLISQVSQELGDGFCQNLASALALDVGDIHPKGFGGGKVSVRI